MEEEKGEHERKLGDREKMSDLMLNISQSKNSQEVESQEKRGAYPRMQGTGGGRWTPPVPPRQLRSRPPSSKDLFVNDKTNNSNNNTKKNQREKQERPT